MESQKENCTSDSGSLDWHLLRKHLVEKYGKIPGREAIPGILQRASQEWEDIKVNIGRVKQSKAKGNPVKKTLEEYGISFPSSCPAVNIDQDVDEQNVCSSLSSTPSAATPTTAEEEQYQIQTAIRESLYMAEFEQPTFSHSISSSPSPN